MSGTVRSSGAVSIPASVRKTIQNLREIAGNHSDEEIYAMLKECNMDPNETAQKLLYQDPFHEVKRKRDKRKENVSVRDAPDVRSRPGSQGRGGRGGRGNYNPRYISQDGVVGRGSSMSRENGVYQNANRASLNSALPSSTTSQNAPAKTSVTGMSSISTPTTDVPTLPNGTSTNASGPQVQAQAGGWGASTGNSTMADILKSSTVQQVQTPPQIASFSASVTVQGQPSASSQQSITSGTLTSVSGVYSSSSDPVLVPSLDTRVSGAVGTIKREVGAQRVNVEQTGSLHENKSAVSNLSNSLQNAQTSMPDSADSGVKVSANENSASIHSFSHDNIGKKSQIMEGDHHLSDMQTQVLNSTTTSSMSRPSVIANHYNIRAQQVVGAQKAVGPNKEWKPKPTTQSAVASPGVIGTSAVSTSTSEVSRSPSPASNSMTLEDPGTKLHKKLEELNVRDDRHVIMPNHLQVPDVERTGLSFGSFDANFGGNFVRSYGNDDESEKSSTPSTEESQGAEEAVEEPVSSSNTASVIPHEDYAHHQVSPPTVDNIPSTNDDAVSINPAVASQSDPTKADVVVQPGPQYSLVQTAPNYSSISLVPQIMGSQYPSYEQAEPQIRDVTRVPNFVQQTPYDHSSSYYTPMIRPNADGDARFSPFIGSPAASKYNGSLTILSGQNVPASQEGNPLVLSNAGPTALATQTAGIVQTTIPLAQAQQPVPVYRQPASVHISHYPPNYLPYHQYLSPFYVPSPTMHNFVGNSGFTQLPAGSSYPQAAAGSSYPQAAAGVKFSLSSQYKPGTASGNSPHIGLPAGYGSYTAAPSGYSASPSVTAGNPSGVDDMGGSQYKENNVYIAGQQGEGSPVWFQGPPRDLLGMQANSYYNIPPQGQHVTFAHTQGGHATYAGLYHPTQSGPAPNAHPLLQQTQTLGGAVGVGAQAGVYQQPQRPQLNWANNY